MSRDLVQKHKISSFYTAPTAIRAIQKSGDEPVKKYDRSSLRVLGTVGEPINPAAWKWYDCRSPLVHFASLITTVSRGFPSMLTAAGTSKLLEKADAPLSIPTGKQKQYGPFIDVALKPF